MFTDRLRLCSAEDDRVIPAASPEFGGVAASDEVKGDDPVAAPAPGNPIGPSTAQEHVVTTSALDHFAPVVADDAVHARPPAKWFPTEGSPEAFAPRIRSLPDCPWMSSMLDPPISLSSPDPPLM